MKAIKSTLLVMATPVFAGCASKLVVQSDPPQAAVYLNVEGRKERVKVGETPIELTEPQIAESLKLSSESVSWIEVTLEKKDHETRTVYLPSNRWGERVKNIRLTLKTMDDPTTTVSRMFKHFFNAKKFAETKQFEQAHSEIDKVLQLDSKMPQALNMKAGIFFLQGNMADAQKLYQQAIESDPGSNEAVMMLEKIKNKGGGQ